MGPGRTPPLYEGMVLHVLGDSGLEPYDLTRTSRSGVIKYVERFGGVGLVPLQDFDPDGRPKLSSPEEVKLHDGAEFVVIPSTFGGLDQRLKSLEGWKKNRTEGRERQLGEALRKHAVALEHTQIDVVYNMKVAGPEGVYRELDAVAFADGCAFVAEYKNKMDWKGADQLASAVDFIEQWKDLGCEGNVTLFKDKRIFGVLAGSVETSDVQGKKAMDNLVKKRNFLKWFEGVDFGLATGLVDPNSPSSPLSCVPVGTDGPDTSPGIGTTTTTTAALPRRVRQVANPMPRVQLQVRPRLVPRFAGLKRPSLI